MEEEILLANESRVAVEVRGEVECAADFRDVFELRDWREAAGRGEVLEEAKDGRLRFAYRRGGFLRGTVVRVEGEGVSPRGARAPLFRGASRARGDPRRARLGGAGGGRREGPASRVPVALRGGDGG